MNNLIANKTNHLKLKQLHANMVLGSVRNLFSAWIEVDYFIGEALTIKAMALRY